MESGNREQRDAGQAGRADNGGFGLVAALAWNTAIQVLFAAVFPEAGDLVATFLYDVVVTVIVVFVTIQLCWLAELAKERERGPLGRLRE